MTKETNYGKLLQAMYDQGFADCEAAAKLAIEAGIKKAMLAEREACAELCEKTWKQQALRHYAAITYSQAANSCAAAIRARGEQ